MSIYNLIFSYFGTLLRHIAIVSFNLFPFHVYDRLYPPKIVSCATLHLLKCKILW